MLQAQRYYCESSKRASTSNCIYFESDNDSKYDYTSNKSHDTHNKYNNIHKNKNFINNDCSQESLDDCLKLNNNQIERCQQLYNDFYNCINKLN